MIANHSTVTAHTNGNCGPGCPCCEIEDERNEALMARALEDARPTLERIIDQLEWWEGANPGRGSYLDAARELRAVIRGEEA